MLTTGVDGQSIIAWGEPRFAGKSGEPVAFAVDRASVDFFDPDAQLSIQS
jgi:hypothetical protein